MRPIIHRFRVGEIVEIVPTTLRPAASGQYEIVRLFPGDTGEPQYCVKSDKEKHQRVVPESDLLRVSNSAVA